MAAHVHDAESAHATAPQEQDPAVLADVRIAAIHRLRMMSVKHAQHAWERRRSDPLAPYGVAFLYVQPDRRPRRANRYHLTAATKLWLAGSEAQDLPRLLFDLARAIDQRITDPSFDVRTSLANRIDDDMDHDASFAGIGVSSLDTYSGTWEQVLSRARADDEIPGCLRMVLTDGSLIVCDRRGLSEFNSLTVHSTHSLDYAPGHAPFAWGMVTAEQLHADPAHAQTVRWMSQLGDILWQGEARRLAAQRSTATSADRRTR